MMRNLLLIVLVGVGCVGCQNAEWRSAMFSGKPIVCRETTLRQTEFPYYECTCIGKDGKPIPCQEGK